jgi:hypothetical protein
MYVAGRGWACFLDAAGAWVRRVGGRTAVIAALRRFTRKKMRGGEWNNVIQMGSGVLQAERVCPQQEKKRDVVYALDDAESCSLPLH